MATPFELVLSCEHASAHVPEAYRHLFRDAEAALRSHDGYDLGALALAEALGRRFATPVVAAAVSRLVVDANRSPENPRVFSRYVRSLDRAARRTLLATYHTPHREAVAARAAAAITAGRCVFHVGVHTFTPVWQGRVRQCDVGLLYDPQRKAELEICRRWQSRLQSRHRGLRVRRNAPYRGRDDGLTRTLRRRFPERAYVGIELEINQALAACEAPDRSAWFVTLAETLAEVVGVQAISRRTGSVSV